MALSLILDNSDILIHHIEYQILALVFLIPKSGWHFPS